MDNNLEYSEIIETIAEKKLNLNIFLELYRTNKFQELLLLCIKHDLLEAVKILYENYNVKVYISDIDKMIDKNLSDELNNDNTFMNSYYKISITKMNLSIEYIIYMKKYSKLNKDEKGFFYLFSKK